MDRLEMNAAVKEFVDLCEKYGPDKCRNHHYEAMYAHILGPFRFARTRIRILEIGIEFGGSLRVWLEYLKSPLGIPYVYGIDIEQKYCDKAPPGARAFCGDQADVNFLESVVKDSGGEFDIIIDDGGHGTGQAEVTFKALWPHLRDGGIYVIEDLEWSSKTTRQRWAKRHNLRTTVEWLLDEVQSRTYRHRLKWSAHDSVWTFWGEACVVTKLPQGT